MSETSGTEFVRITIDIPQDTVTQLDKMKDFAGYASRGRTIQALVDAVLEMGADSTGLNQTNASFQKSWADAQTGGQQQQAAALLVFFTQYTAWVNNITRRLSRFLKIA